MEREAFPSALALAGARLECCEQPHVLDCENGLVGKGPEKVDLTVRERPCLQLGNAWPPRPSDRAAAKRLSVEVRLVAVRNPGELDAVFTALTRDGVAGMVYGASSKFFGPRHALPTTR
jgi:hypothetical protein